MTLDTGGKLNFPKCLARRRGVLRDSTKRPNHILVKSRNDDFNADPNGLRLLRLGLVELAPATAGGASTYSRALGHAIDDLAQEFDIQVVRFVNEALGELIHQGQQSWVSYRKTSGDETHTRGRYSGLGRRLRKNRTPTLQEALNAHSIDLVWFSAPNRVINSVVDTPFVMTVWDLAHREVQGFTEFASGGRWAQRETALAANVGRAFHVVTDSSYTGHSLERIYGIFPGNWSSAGLPPPLEVESDNSLSRSIPKPYFYYPANYWPHKNHRVLIDALGKLPVGSAELVFSGQDFGGKAPLEEFVKRNNLSSSVRLFPHITDAQVQGLIDGAVAVLMPSLLGPTNYPPLEALRRGTPAIVSDAHYFDFGDAEGLKVVDRFSPELWAGHMYELLSSAKPPSFTPPTAMDSVEVFRQVFSKFLNVQKTKFQL